jgi:hypothetical protein
MTMKFSHPLARAAKIWSVTTKDASVQPILVIVTTLALDPENKRYKKHLVNRLSEAAREHISANPAIASGFVLMNRLRDWDGSRG